VLRRSRSVWFPAYTGALGSNVRGLFLRGGEGMGPGFPKVFAQPSSGPIKFA